MYKHRILASTAFALTLIPLGALAQNSNKVAATFTERYPAEETLTQTPPAATKTQTPPASQKTQTRPESPKADKAATARAASANRPRARVVVAPRSYLDAGTEVLPGERKFLDYAYPPTYQPYNVVTNIGGRVGWHNSPLPGPFFPWAY